VDVDVNGDEDGNVDVDVDGGKSSHTTCSAGN